jgi:flagellar assembly protein FliH
MSDILKLNGNGKGLRVRVNNSLLNDQDTEKEIEENYIQTNLQNYYDRGYSEGRESAKEEFEAEYEKQISEEIEKFNSIVEKLDTFTTGYDKIFNDLVVNLSILISEKIIRSELSNKKIISETVQAALKKVIGSNNIIVKLNPNDLKTISEKSNKTTQDGSLSNIKFEADEGIETGGCFVKTEIGNVDARISTQIEELKKLLEESF